MHIKTVELAKEPKRKSSFSLCYPNCAGVYTRRYNQAIDYIFNDEALLFKPHFQTILSNNYLTIYRVVLK